MVISREGIHTKTSLKAQLDISSKTKRTKTKPNNLAHSESNLLDETRTTSVLIFVSFTITVLVFNIFLVVYLKNKNGTYKITRRRILKVVRWLSIWILSYIFFQHTLALCVLLKFNDYPTCKLYNKYKTLTISSKCFHYVFLYSIRLKLYLYCSTINSLYFASI